MTSWNGRNCFGRSPADRPFRGSARGAGIRAGPSIGPSQRRRKRRAGLTTVGEVSWTAFGKNCTIVPSLPATPLTAMIVCFGSGRPNAGRHSLRSSKSQPAPMNRKRRDLRDFKEDTATARSAKRGIGFLFAPQRNLEPSAEINDSDESLNPSLEVRLLSQKPHSWGFCLRGRAKKTW